jgi:hypothetical protein
VRQRCAEGFNFGVKGLRNKWRLKMMGDFRYEFQELVCQSLLKFGENTAKIIFINALILQNQHVITVKCYTHFLSCIVYHYATQSKDQNMKHPH